MGNARKFKSSVVWRLVSGMPKGNVRLVRTESIWNFNHYLETVRARVLRIHRELEQDDKPITAEILKNLFYGESQTPKMLLEVFKEHNTKYRELIGKDVVKATVLRYERTVRYLEEFLKKEYQLNDIPLYNINHEFISNFEFFIKTEKNCAQNATVKYLKNLKKIIILALTNKWMTDNPFSGTGSNKPN